MIKLVDLYKSFGELQVLRGLNLDIEYGKTTSIIGRSGSGKSVLLKHIIGLLKPDRGQVFIDEVDITKLNEKEINEIRKRFGMLFQGSALFDSMTVGENVAFPLREHSRLKEIEIKQIVTERLRAVGLTGVEDKMPAEMSGGMKKRVGLARAIAMLPEIVLFDEPTTGLDPVMAEAINQLIVETQKNFNLTCIVISHDIHSIYTVSHKIAMLYDGVIVEYGTPDELRASTNPVTIQFLSGDIEGPITIV